MKVYLDICCLKRPFDDQSQARIALETAAVLSVLRAIELGVHTGVRSPSHDFENAANPDARRAQAVADWLVQCGPAAGGAAGVETRFRALRAMGLGQLDAYHVSWAVELGADVFLTTDDRLIARSAPIAAAHGLRVTDPVTFVRETRL